MESLVFTLKEGFEFAQMVRRTHDNVLAEMLEKVLAYNLRRSSECGESFQSAKRPNAQLPN